MKYLVFTTYGSDKEPNEITSFYSDEIVEADDMTSAVNQFVEDKSNAPARVFVIPFDPEAISYYDLEPTYRMRHAGGMKDLGKNAVGVA